MNSIARMVNGIFSVIGILMGLTFFLLSGLMTAFIPNAAAYAAVTAMLPVIIIVVSIIGLYGVIRNNKKIQIAFDICLLPGWYVGTLIGGVCLVLFYLDSKGKESQSAVSNN
jgi:hypothetical protein